MPAVARLGDTSSHGGVIIAPVSTTMTADERGIARVGDLHSCPIEGHGITALGGGSPTFDLDGKRVIRVGDAAGCGAIIQTGSPTLIVD